MIVYRAKELDITLGRTHPWTIAGYDANCSYIDFREEPERIVSSLEDFQEWAEYAATQRFYDLIRWLNGADSLFETNDTAFSIEPNCTPDQPYKLQASGRLMLFPSDMRLTCATGFAEWMMARFHFHLAQIQPPLAAAAVGISRAPCLFKSANAKGDEVVLYFWAWGNTNDTTMSILDKVFDRLRMAAEKVNDDVRESLRGSANRS